MWGIGLRSRTVSASGDPRWASFTLGVDRAIMRCFIDFEELSHQHSRQEHRSDSTWRSALETLFEGSTLVVPG